MGVRMPFVLLGLQVLCLLPFRCTCHKSIFLETIKTTMKLFVFSTLLAAAAAFTSQPVTGPAKVVDSPARARTATIVQDGKANGTLGQFACVCTL